MPSKLNIPNYLVSCLRKINGFNKNANLNVHSYILIRMSSLSFLTIFTVIVPCDDPEGFFFQIMREGGSIYNLK